MTWIIHIFNYETYTTYLIIKIRIKLFSLIHMCIDLFNQFIIAESNFLLQESRNKTKNF